MDPNADKNMFFNNLERLNKKSCPLAVGKNPAATTKPKPKAGMPTGKTKTEPGERPDKPDKHKRYYQQKKAW